MKVLITTFDINDRDSKQHNIIDTTLTVQDIEDNPYKTDCFIDKYLKEEYGSTDIGAYLNTLDNASSFLKEEINEINTLLNTNIRGYIKYNDFDNEDDEVEIKSVQELAEIAVEIAVEQGFEIVENENNWSRYLFSGEKADVGFLIKGLKPNLTKLEYMYIAEDLLSVINAEIVTVDKEVLEPEIDREKIINDLVDNEIKEIIKDIALGDYTVIDSAVRGEGYLQFNNFTNKQLIEAHNELMQKE